MTELLKSNESRLIGQWHVVDGVVVQDGVCERIQWLTDSRLEQLAVDGKHWSALYKDPNDGRLWELQYPQSGMHGGGPPALTCIDRDTAIQRYGSGDF